MKKTKFAWLAVASVAAAITLGMLDHETESFLGLFAEPGNIAGLLVWSALFFLAGAIFLVLAETTWRLFLRSKTEDGTDTWPSSRP